MKRPFLLTAYCLLFTILLLVKEATSGEIRVAILDFQDKGSTPSPQTKERVYRIFEDLFSKLDSEIVEKGLVTSVQKGVEEVTLGIAKIMGRVIEADLVVMGDYKIEKGVLSINSYFIDTGKKDLKDMDEEIIRQIREMGIKEFNVGSDEIAFLNISMVLGEEKEEGKILPFGAEETYLFITSRPGNAKIYINDKLRGLTPQAFTDIPPSVYRIRLVKDGLKKEQTIILKKGDRIRLDIDLYDQIPISFPIFKKVASVKLFVIETPYTISKGKYHVSIDYPEILILRYGVLKEGIEIRIQGLGMGVKYKWKWLGFSLLYKTRNLRESKEGRTLDTDIVFTHSVDTPLGIFDLYSGFGYRFLNDTGLRCFIGFETYFLPEAKLLMEYDRYEGGAVGFRYPLPYNLRLTLGLGLTSTGKARYDGNLSYHN
ncbi:MAG: PEGA domain-containing protein [bacterium]|nr:PEGA domain-containing protein [bacterium]